MAENTVQVELSIEEQKALKALTTLSKKFEEFGDDAQKSIKKSDLALASFAGNLAAIAAAKGLELVSDGFRFLVGSIGEATKMAAESQQAQANLSIALAQTGKFTVAGAKAFEDYADSVEKSTGISGEAVLETASFIQQINKLSQQDLKKATQATIDFSAALNVDLGTASSLVGKAIEGNTTGLKKFGIEVQKGATDTERLNNVLTALQGVSGAAEAKTKTFAGGFALFNVAIEDFRKAIGFLIIENPAVIASLKGLSQGLQFFTGILTANKGAITDFITNAVIKLVESLRFAADVVVFFNKAFAGFEIVGKIFQQGLFIAENAIRSFGLAINEGVVAIREFAGLDVSESQRKYIENQKALVEINKENVAGIDKEISAIMSRTNAQNRAVTDTTNVVINSTKAALDAQKTAQEEGNAAFFESINARAAIAAEGEQKVVDAVQLVRDAAKARELEKANEETLSKQLATEADFQFLQERLGKEEALREVARATELSKTGGHNAAILSLQAARAKAEQKGIFQVQKYEELSQQQRLDNLKSTLGSIATLQSSGSKELFMIGKAAALGMATIDGIQAVQKALASAPPPFNYALAAAVGLATAANVAKIAAQQPPKFADGGIVGGNSFSGDRVTAQLNSGEMVLNRQQQTRLFNMAENGGSSTVVNAINALGDRIANMNIIVQANSREIARLVRDERQAGFVV